VVIIGRRGPLQSTFTTLELRELGELEGVDVVVDPADLADITDEDAQAAGKLAGQHQGAARLRRARAPAEGCAASCSGSAPRRSRSAGGSGSSPSCSVRNELVTDDSGRVVARDTGEREDLPPSWWCAPSAIAGCESGAAVRRRRRRDPARGGPGSGHPGTYVGLDQARPVDHQDQRRTPDTSTLVADLAAGRRFARCRRTMPTSWCSGCWIASPHW
jgi:ferredoxin--NADP+ reductase